MKVLIIASRSSSLVNFRGDFIKALIQKGNSVITVGPEKGHEGRINELGASFFSIPLNRAGVNLFGDLRYLYQLCQIIRKIKPDIVLTYTVKPNIYGTIASKLCHVKKVYVMITGTGSTFMPNSKKEKLLNYVVKMLYSISLGLCYKAIFQNNDDLGDFCRDRLVKKEKCFIVNGSGVNLNKYSANLFPQRNNREFVFLFIGRFVKTKGILEFLQASNALTREYADVKINVIGDYDANHYSIDKADIEPFLHNSQISFIGRVDDVRPFINDCSVFVLPSYREGTPRSVLEAMSMKKPIITTDAPGCRETVINTLNGFLVPAKNVDLLKEKMEWFINNNERLLDMGVESYKLCLEKFDVSKVNRKMLEIMEVC